MSFVSFKYSLCLQSCHFNLPLEKHDENLPDVNIFFEKILPPSLKMSKTLKLPRQLFTKGVGFISVTDRSVKKNKNK